MEGGGVIPQPGPVSWKTATQDDISDVQRNISMYQAVKNPLEFLEENFNTTQFKITDYEKSAMGITNEGDFNSQVFVDTKSMYVKERYTNSSEIVTNEYCAYHEDTKHEGGVYYCYEGEDKINNLCYKSSTVDKAINNFVYAKNSNTDVQYFISNIYTNDKYEVRDDSEGLLPAVWEYYHLIEQFGKFEHPTMSYEQGNDLSFKVTHSGTYQISAEFNTTYDVNFNFELIVENALLKKYSRKMEVPEMGYSMEWGSTIEAATFELDDLSPYFTK